MRKGRKVWPIFFKFGPYFDEQTKKIVFGILSANWTSQSKKEVSNASSSIQSIGRCANHILVNCIRWLEAPNYPVS